MKTSVYCISDIDVIETFFGEDPVSKAIWKIARDNAELIFMDNDAKVVPGDGIDDTIAIAGHEYAILARSFLIEGPHVIFIVRPVVEDDQEQAS